MADYTLSESAREDLKNIYRFGFEHFGEQQAESYFNGLIACFDEIVKNPLQFQRIPEVGVDYRRCVYISDSIYFRVKNKKIEIMAIIGRQDTITRF